MHLAWYGRKLSAQKNANWGVGVILSQIAMVTMIMIVAYIWNFFLLGTTWCIFWPNIGLL